jgi:hypothetical protein
MFVCDPEAVLLVKGQVASIGGFEVAGVMHGHAAI